MKPPIPVLSVVALAVGAFTSGWSLHKYSVEREQARNRRGMTRPRPKPWPMRCAMRARLNRA